MPMRPWLVCRLTRMIGWSPLLAGIAGAVAEGLDDTGAQELLDGERSVGDLGELAVRVFAFAHRDVLDRLGRQAEVVLDHRRAHVRLLDRVDAEQVRSV